MNLRKLIDGDAGLGDTIARATKTVGIQPCSPCEERRKKLNAMVPYRTREILAEGYIGDMECFVSKEHGKFCVRSHQTNKNFGCYEDRGQAESRLSQIRRFK